MDSILKKNFRVGRLAAIMLLLVILFLAGPVKRQSSNTVEAYSGRARHIGYGISVAPFVTSRPDLVNAMGLDWIKIYQTDQIDDYPNQHVLFRVDVPGDPANWDG